jgi:hypothetical protein
MTPQIRAAAVALYDRFTHDGLDRRSFMTRTSTSATSLGAWHWPVTSPSHPISSLLWAAHRTTTRTAHAR